MAVYDSLYDDRGVSTVAQSCAGRLHTTVRTIRRWRVTVLLCSAVLWATWSRYHPDAQDNASAGGNGPGLQHSERDMADQGIAGVYTPKKVASNADVAVPRPRPQPGLRTVVLANRGVEIELETVEMAGQSHLTLKSFTNTRLGRTQLVYPELFAMDSYSGQHINSTLCNTTDLKVVNEPGQAQFASATMQCPYAHTMFWSIVLDKDADYGRIRVQWSEDDERVHFVPHFIVLLQLPSGGIKHQGTVLGSPFVQKDSLLYFGVEHPLGVNGILTEDKTKAVCASSYLPAPKKTGKLNPGLSVVVGSVIEARQLRRSFQRYLEANRAHPSRPFLHYNSWFDFSSWQEPNESLHYRSMSEKICLDRVQRFGDELVTKRGVVMDSFLWDDGWDNQSSLWDFNQKTFPRGFDEVNARAKRYKVGTGVWVSPWGGYGEAKESRLAIAKAQGYETGPDGFILSGPKYFKKFHDIMLSMVTRYGVNMFKVDGIGFEGNHTVIATEMEGMLNLVHELRVSAKKRDNAHLFMSLTTGTWPSPFWLLHGDSVWRGHGDLGLEGSGSHRQMWVTYRDAVVYHLVVMRASLFPLSALMLHGIILGAVGQARHAGLDSIGELSHFEQEVWSYYSMGVCLQELYLSPDLMTNESWDVVAAAAKWARANNDVLQDSHWVGSDPLRSVYGFAAWSEKRHVGIITLRNPTKTQITVSLDVEDTLELPKAYAHRFYDFHQVYGTPTRLSVRTNETFKVLLKPLAVLVLQGKANATAV